LLEEIEDGNSGFSTPTPVFSEKAKTMTDIAVRSATANTKLSVVKSAVATSAAVLAAPGVALERYTGKRG
jgi:hypothetical protein